MVVIGMIITVHGCYWYDYNSTWLLLVYDYNSTCYWYDYNSKVVIGMIITVHGCYWYDYNSTWLLLV